MARQSASRKYQITINNPQAHGFDREHIKKILEGFSGLDYWCLCDEVGEKGTSHTHVYVLFRNAVMFTTLQKRFYGAHIEQARGSNLQNRDYIRKEGKWADDTKKDTNLIDSFEESGELPPERDTDKKQSELIFERIKEGASNIDIISEFPSALNKINYMEQLRQGLLEEKYKNDFRELEVTYIWGAAGSGKTRSVMERYGYPNVYRVSNYSHPFDNYKGQDVLLFDEFRSSLPISEMLTCLDGYPYMLPCRYADKAACFTKIYFTTNIPLSEQYKNVQIENPETWIAFLRRIHTQICMNGYEELDSTTPVPFEPESEVSHVEGLP